jgi:hypothetical protein
MKGTAAAGITLAALALNPAIAYADHIDTLPPPSEPHGMAAMYLCQELDDSPTAETYLANVNEMREAGYTQEKTDMVTWFAITYACPEYKQLADAALRHPPKVVYA